jgi:hypothetical protein
VLSTLKTPIPSCYPAFCNRASLVSLAKLAGTAVESVPQNAPDVIELASRTASSPDQQQPNAISLDFDAIRQAIDRIATVQEQITSSTDPFATSQPQIARSLDQFTADQEQVSARSRNYEIGQSNSSRNSEPSLRPVSASAPQPIPRPASTPAAKPVSRPASIFKPKPLSRHRRNGRCPDGWSRSLLCWSFRKGRGNAERPVLVDSGCPPHGLGPAVLLHRGPGYLPHAKKPEPAKLPGWAKLRRRTKPPRRRGRQRNSRVLAADGVEAATMVPILA